MKKSENKGVVGMASVVAVACLASVMGGHEALSAGRQSAAKPGAASTALWEQMQQGPHTGSVQDALVGVEVTASSSDGAVKKLYRGNGLLLRCDGFVLVPTGLFNTTLDVAGSKEEASGLQITIVVRPGGAGEKRLTAHRERYERPGLGFVVTKIDNWHGTAMTTESPASLAAGTAVSLYWIEWDSATRQWGSFRQTPAKLAQEPMDDERQRPGRRAFAQSLERVPLGAVVLGPSGRAVGLVVKSGADKGTEDFIGFDALGLATNCVVPETPVPDDHAADPGSALPPAAAGAAVAPTPMVKVSGGPVLLPPGVIQQQPDLEGARFACVAPFEIDKFEVTNKQYLAFWNTLPASRRSELWFQSQFWPAGWSKRGEPFPAEISDFPVIGVPSPGADAFARSQGKRLPTPYEWCLAAFGPDGGTRPPEWMTAYLKDRQAIWEKASNIHMEYRETTLAASQNSRNPDMYQLPWIASTPDLMEASVWSKRTLEQLVEPIRGRYDNPDYLTSVGEREVDDSPSGARDMLLNAAELVVTYPGPPTRGNDRFMSSEFIPMKLPQNAQFVPRHIELIGAREGNPPYPQLSRLFKRLINGPSTADLVAWSNVAELQRILSPPGGWEIRMATQVQLGYMGRPPGRGLAALGRAPGLKLWEEIPRHFRLETGLPIPLEVVDKRIPTGPSLLYMPIGGFRCARAL